MLSGGFSSSSSYFLVLFFLSVTDISFRYLIAYKNLLRAIENIGIAVVYGIRYIVIVYVIFLVCANLQKVLRHREDNA